MISTTKSHFPKIANVKMKENAHQMAQGNRKKVRTKNGIIGLKQSTKKDFFSLGKDVSSIKEWRRYPAPIPDPNIYRYPITIIKKIDQMEKHHRSCPR